MALDPSVASLGATPQLNRLGVYYHGAIDRAEAEERLLLDGHVGAWLVREKTRDLVYAFSFLNAEKQPTHVRIHRAIQPDGTRAGHFSFDRIHLAHCRAVFDVIEELFLPIDQRHHYLFQMVFVPEQGVRVDCADI